VGAGTWADDATCAVSGTGHGEAFLRCALAHEVDACLRLRGMALGAACDAALARVAELGSSGGCIAVDREGTTALRFNSAGMLRGWIDEAGRARVAIYAGE
jgi:isoaspartyl peptidase/L-asparaginase-like protein (Ntn-hydrolase superfamily)